MVIKRRQYSINNLTYTQETKRWLRKVTLKDKEASVKEINCLLLTKTA